MSFASSDLKRAAPIFVIGRNRSGTKWLSNILLNHTAVAGVQSEHKNGIAETDVFGPMQRVVGDIRRAENYVAFVAIWSQTDFFRASGADAEMFLTCSPRPTTMFEAFRLLMEWVAARQGRPFWLQKTAADDRSERILKHYPDARVVTIQRGLMGNLWSTLANATRQQRDSSAIRSAIGYALDEKNLARLQRKGALAVRYEDLRNNTETETRRVCEALGLQFEPDMIDVRFRPNTSFQGGERVPLSARQILAARLAYSVARYFPISLLQALRIVSQPRRVPLRRGMFGDIVRRYGIRDA